MKYKITTPGEREVIIEAQTVHRPKVTHFAG